MIARRRLRSVRNKRKRPPQHHREAQHRMIRLALIASPSLRRGPLSPLQRFARDFEVFLSDHEIHTTEGCYRALLHSGVFVRHPRFFPTIPGFRGGIVQLAAGVIPSGGAAPIDAVIYLIDPQDPSSNYPETNALKRECVVNAKPFLATSRSAREWTVLRWRTGGAHLLQESNRFGAPVFRTRATQTIALIAHDKKKSEMLRFALRHFDLLRSFQQRIGTGTTAELLNGLHPKRLTGKQWREVRTRVIHMRRKLRAAGVTQPFVDAFKSGPRGGDVQIAQLILRGDCQIVCFFEDPFVPREHEQDIQLLERTGRVRGKDVICIHDPTTAEDLAKRWADRRHPAVPEPLLVATALERAFGVKAVLVGDAFEESPKAVWEAILRTAASVLYAEVNRWAYEKKLRSEVARVTLAWGMGMSELIDELSNVPDRLQRLDERVAQQLASLGRRSLERPLADLEYITPVHVVAAPMQGIMAADDESVEGNEIARRFGAQFGGHSLELPLAAVLKRKGRAAGQRDRRDLIRGVADHWLRTDLLVTGCAPVREEYAGHAPVFQEYYQQIRRSACGDVGGIYLEEDGTVTETDPFERIGMSVGEARAVRSRGGSFLIVGGEASRVTITRAALRAGVVSVLITDLAFGRRLLLG